MMELPSTALKIEAVARAQPLVKHSRLLLNFGKGLLSAALIYFILQDTALADIQVALSSANAGLLVLAFGMTLLGHVVSSYRWRILLQAQGTDASILFLLKSYLVGTFFNNVLPSTIGGDTIRAYDTWRLGRSKAVALSVIFIDRFLGLFALMLFALAALLIPNELTTNLPLLPLWVLLFGGGTVLILWLIFAPSYRSARLLSRRLPFMHTLYRVGTAFSAYRGRTDVLVQTLLYSLLLQAIAVFHYYLIANALGLNVPLLSFFLIVPIAVLLMTIPLSINGIGIRENIFAFLFASFGVSTAEAVAFAWVVLGLLILQGILGGIIYLLRR